MATADTSTVWRQRDKRTDVSDSSALAMVSCDVCGDDIGVHEWVRGSDTIDGPLIVACDRSGAGDLPSYGGQL